MRAILALSIVVLLSGCVTSRDRMISEMRANPMPEPRSCSSAMSYISTCNNAHRLEFRLGLPLTDCFAKSRITELCGPGETVYLAGGAAGYAGRLCDLTKQVITDQHNDMLTCVKR